jgi:hypothetical protein
VNVQPAVLSVEDLYVMTVALDNARHGSPMSPESFCKEISVLITAATSSFDGDRVKQMALAIAATHAAMDRPRQALLYVYIALGVTKFSFDSGGS